MPKASGGAAGGAGGGSASTRISACDTPDTDSTWHSALSVRVPGCGAAVPFVHMDMWTSAVREKEDEDGAISSGRGCSCRSRLSIRFSSEMRTMSAVNAQSTGAPIFTCQTV